MDPKTKELWMNIGLQLEFTAYDQTGAMLQPRIHDDVPSFMEIPIAWKAGDLTGADAAFLGIPWEGMIHLSPMQWASCGPRPPKTDVLDGRSGAYDAPDYIRKHSSHYSLAISGGFYPEVGPDFKLVDHLTLMDYRNADFDKWDVEDMVERAVEKVGDIVRAGAVPLVFGGDHSTPYPVLRGISDNSEDRIGIILFDSHYDNSYGGDFPPPFGDLGRLNAGNAFYKVFDTCRSEPANMVIIGIKGGAYNTQPMHELAVKLGMTVFTNEDVEEMGIASVVGRAIEVATRDTDRVYVSLDVDSMDPASFPAQKYPDPFGLPARDVRRALAMISRETDLAGFDMVCMGPAYDVQNLGGLTAVRLYLELLKGLAIRKSAQS